MHPGYEGEPEAGPVGKVKEILSDQAPLFDAKIIRHIDAKMLCSHAERIGSTGTVQDIATRSRH